MMFSLRRRLDLLLVTDNFMFVRACPTVSLQLRFTCRLLFIRVVIYGLSTCVIFGIARQLSCFVTPENNVVERQVARLKLLSH